MIALIGFPSGGPALIPDRPVPRAWPSGPPASPATITGWITPTDPEFKQRVACVASSERSTRNGAASPGLGSAEWAASRVRGHTKWRAPKHDEARARRAQRAEELMQARTRRNARPFLEKGFMKGLGRTFRSGSRPDAKVFLLASSGAIVYRPRRDGKAFRRTPRGRQLCWWGPAAG